MKVLEIQAKQILNHLSGDGDEWFDEKYNMNLYRGCQHHCIYCDSRSLCYQIEDFDGEILVKVNAIELLKEELPSKRIKARIGLGAMNDSYMPIEKKYQLTRRAMEVIAREQFPVHIITKSALVTRDIDLLQEINLLSPDAAVCSFTLTTVDDDLARIIEPGAALPSQRLAAMRQLSDAGIITGVSLMPILPFIEDNVENIREIVRQTADHGGSYFIPSFGMSLRDRQRHYYYQKLDEHFPGLKEKYIRAFGGKYSAPPNNVKGLYTAFHEECNHLDLQTRCPNSQK